MQYRSGVYCYTDWWWDEKDAPLPIDNLAEHNALCLIWPNLLTIKVHEPKREEYESSQEYHQAVEAFFVNLKQNVDTFPVKLAGAAQRDLSDMSLGYPTMGHLVTTLKPIEFVGEFSRRNYKNARIYRIGGDELLHQMIDAANLIEGSPAAEIATRELERIMGNVIYAKFGSARG